MTDIATLVIKADTSQVKTATKDLDKLSNSSVKAESSSKDLSSSFTAMRSALPVAGLGILATLMVKSADALTKFTAQLRNATSSQSEFSEAFENVRRIASSAQAPIEAVGSTYSRLSNALKDLNVSQAQVSDVAETVALGLKVNGASAEETASAMLQLSQSFGSGRMQGDEFRSAMESMPSLMREVAKTMGVTVGELKSLSSEGAITSEVLLKTFNNPVLLDKLREQAESMRTIGGSMTEAKNELLLFTGTMAQRTGVVDGFNFIIDAGTNTLKGFNDQLSTGQIRLQGFLPAYDAYRKRMDKDYKAPSTFTFAPKIGEEGGNFNLGEYGANAPNKSLIRDIQGLKENKPLKDLISLQQEYAKSLSIVNAAEKEGLMTAQEAARYRAQLSKELESYNRKEIADNTKLQEQRKKALEENNKEEVRRLNVAIWVNEQIALSQQKANEEMAVYTERRMDIEQKRANENFEEAQRIYKEQLDAEKKLTEESKKGFEDLERAIDGYAKNASAAMTDFIFGTETSFGDMINSMLKDLARLALQKAIFDPIVTGITGALGSEGGIGSVFKSLLPGFANGSEYIPRDMVANIHQGERILTREENRNYSKGMAGNVNVNVTVNSNGSSSVQSDANFGKQLGNAIKSVVQSEMLKQKRQGGLLA